MSKYDNNYAAYGLAGIIATIITGYVLYKNNKKVQEKVDSISETIKEKTENEKVTQIKEKSKETINKVTEVVKEKTEVAKQAVKNTAEKAMVKTFEFTIKHPKAAKRIAFGLGGAAIFGIGALGALHGRKRADKTLINYSEITPEGDSVFDFNDSDSLKSNFDRFSEFVSTITLNPGEIFVIESGKADDGQYHTQLAQIWGKGEMKAARF